MILSVISETEYLTLQAVASINFMKFSKQLTSKRLVNLMLKTSDGALSISDLILVKKRPIN
jgi:hypothetical protein